MNRLALTLAAASLASISAVQAQTQPAAPAAPPPPPQYPNMSFFIHSQPGPDGANLGGLDGADRLCQAAAQRAGAGAKTWRAYLSQQAVDGKPAVNAKDRIGSGPWQNAKGAVVAANVSDLHDADKNKINTENGLTETDRMVPNRMFFPNMHDIMTGTQMDGTAPPPDKDMTCGNWTKGGAGAALVGHHDRMGLADTAAAKSWNSSHPSRACDNASLRATGGNGLFYCFAAN